MKQIIRSISDTQPAVKMAEEFVGRWVFDGTNLRKGYVRVSDDGTAEVCEGTPPQRSTKAVILPGFVNSHTHIGDSFAYPAPKGSVEDIVAPPDGYKHRALRSAPRERKLAAMREAAMHMARTGTDSFVDFREEGAGGLREIALAVRDCPVRSCVLGRPSVMDDPLVEAASVLDACDGFGLSAARDMEEGLLRELSSMARSSRKGFALHASECVREDIDGILDLRPSFLVHMTAAQEADFGRCAAAGVPIVVCPRSNQFFGLKPRISEMLRSGVTVALGTDNCMICRPDMIEEMKAAFAARSSVDALTPADVVRLATANGRKVLNATGKILTDGASETASVVIRVSGDDPMLELVTTSTSEDVHAVIRGGKVWRAESCRRSRRS